MLVMFGNGGNLVLAIVDSDVEKLKSGLTLEYVNPPHEAPLVKNILVVHGADREEVLSLVRAAGINITESFAETYRASGRTDRGFKDS